MSVRRKVLRTCHATPVRVGNAFARELSGNIRVALVYVCAAVLFARHGRVQRA